MVFIYSQQIKKYNQLEQKKFNPISLNNKLRPIQNNSNIFAMYEHLKKELSEFNIQLNTKNNSIRILSSISLDMNDYTDKIKNVILQFPSNKIMLSIQLSSRTIDNKKSVNYKDNKKLQYFLKSLHKIHNLLSMKLNTNHITAEVILDSNLSLDKQYNNFLVTEIMAEKINRNEV